MIRYKIDVIQALKAKGYNSNRIRQDKIFGQQQLQKIRQGEIASKSVLNIICWLLDCQPGDILEYVPDTIPDQDTTGESDG